MSEGVNVETLKVEEKRKSNKSFIATISFIMICVLLVSVNIFWNIILHNNLAYFGAGMFLLFGIIFLFVMISLLIKNKNITSSSIENLEFNSEYKTTDINSMALDPSNSLLIDNIYHK